MSSLYHMGGDLWVERHREHVYIKDNNGDDVIALYIPQGDCERVAEALLDIAKKYDAEQQVVTESDKLKRLIEGRGLPGEKEAS